MTKTITAGLFALALLAGCSRSEPEAEEATMTNSVEEVTAPIEEPTPAPAPVEAVPEAAPAPVAPPKAEAIAPDEQMQDDADATGMTARVRRDGETPDETTTNDAAPQ